MELDIQTPRVFVPLLQPARYKGVAGGRGAGRSHFIAERMIEDAVAEHHRIACVREFQSSIRDSSKRILEDKIRKFGLETLFTTTDQEIRGPNDSLFVFKGMSSQTETSIKSIEGFTRLWCEEAQTISQNSLDLLTPTFREQAGLAKPEMWFGWNPKKDDDPVDKLFHENRGDADFIYVHSDYRGNPWFPPDLRRDMERDRRRDPDKYAHIWLGGYEQKSEARVFKNWRIEQFETPSDARFYFGADWGYAVDPSVLIRCWVKGETLFVDHEAYQVGCEVDKTPALFDTVPGAKKWPIRADSARPETISYMQRHGFPRMEPAVKGQNSVIEGVEFLKNYDIVVHPRCVHTADELTFYKYKIDKKTKQVLPVLEDKKNHVIDSLRYALEVLRHNTPMMISKRMLEVSARR